jgi:hypothetical protein
MSLPPFNSDGLLPPDDYELTIEDLRKSMLVEGAPNGSRSWDKQWRLHLVDNLEILAKQLWQAKINHIFINGSFVEDKDHPNDIDGYFECDLKQLASGELQRDLNSLDPHKVWTWDPKSRRASPNSTKRQLPMWHRYRVELYPHFGQPSGIKDSFGHPLQFPSAFRRSRSNNKQKGIVLLKQ